MKALLKVQHQGKELTITDLANISGLKPSTVRYRLQMGWSVEMMLATSPKRMGKGGIGNSKTDAERHLDAMTRADLPKELRKLLKTNTKTKRYGNYIRSNFREAFDGWFDRVYSRPRGAEAQPVLQEVHP